MWFSMELPKDMVNDRNKPIMSSSFSLTSTITKYIKANDFYSDTYNTEYCIKMRLLSSFSINKITHTC